MKFPCSMILNAEGYIGVISETQTGILVVITILSYVHQIEDISFCTLRYDNTTWVLAFTRDNIHRSCTENDHNSQLWPVRKLLVFNTSNNQEATPRCTNQDSTESAFHIKSWWSSYIGRDNNDIGSGSKEPINNQRSIWNCFITTENTIRELFNTSLSSGYKCLAVDPPMKQ